MGLLKLCGLYINLDGLPLRLSKLCPCCRKPSPPKPKSNDPAAFLMEAAAMKTSVRRISRYSKMTSDDSLDERSESSACQDIKGIPGKKTWRRQAKKWTKKTKKKIALESKSSNEGENKLEKCLKKKAKKHKSGLKENESQEDLPPCNLQEDNEKSAGKQYRFHEGLLKVSQASFHSSLVDIEKKSLNHSKPMAEVHPMPHWGRNADWPYSNVEPSAVEVQAPTSHHLSTECLHRWRQNVSSKLDIRSRSPSPRYRRKHIESTDDRYVRSMPSVIPSSIVNVDRTDENEEEQKDYLQVNEVTPNVSANESPESTDSDQDSDYGNEGEDDSSETEEGPSEDEHSLVVRQNSMTNPVHECYGSVVVCLQEIDYKMVSIGIVEVRGIPWVGGVTGLMLEVGVPPKTQWLALPPDHGPRVPVNLKVTLKIPREAREGQKPSSRRRISKKLSSSDDSLYDGDVPLNMIRISLWICGKVWRYGAIGHALVPLRLSVEQNPKPVVVGLYQQMEPSADLGTLEIGLGFRYEGSQTILTVRVLRACNLKPPTCFAIKGFGFSRKHDGQNIWCKLNLWTEGEKVDKTATSKVVFPVTCDPVFRSNSSFVIPKDNLQNTSVVIKVISGRGITEEVLGKVVLGPLLYLGTTLTPSTQPPPVELSHWGKALNHPTEVTVWHKLYE